MNWETAPGKFGRFAWCKNTGVSHKVTWTGQRWDAACGIVLGGDEPVGFSWWDNRPASGTSCPDCYPRRPLLCPKPCGMVECERDGCTIAAFTPMPVTPLALLNGLKTMFECRDCGADDNCLKDDPQLCIPARLLIRAIELLEEQS